VIKQKGDIIKQYELLCITYNKGCRIMPYTKSESLHSI